MKITAPKFNDDELQAVKNVLNSGWVTQGPVTEIFENKIAKLHAAKYALATTSCTAALHLSTMSLMLKPKDEVIVPAFTWITSANCVEYVGAKVVFVDINKETYNIDPIAFEEAINSNTKAVVVVHLFGLAAEMDSIKKIASKYNIAIIEDSACAIGTTYNGNPVGALGDIGCFSFHPRKIITTGEGGMVLTNDHALATIVDSLRNHGSTGLTQQDQDNPRPYSMPTFDRLGFNLRLSDIQAAVGVAQVSKLNALLNERKKIALTYTEYLTEIDEIITPVSDPGHTYQSYVIRIASGSRQLRNKIMDNLKDELIQTRPGTHAVYRLGFYKNKYNLKEGIFPNASLCEDATITLPIFPGMNEKDVAYVVESIKKIIIRFLL